MKKTRKLSLNRQTLANLTHSRLKQVQGGLPMTDGCNQPSDLCDDGNGEICDGSVAKTLRQNC
jgi:hypothetical protein